MKKENARLRLKRAFALATIFAFEVLAALAAGGAVYAPLAFVAFRERGYRAVGGELIAAYAAAVIVFLLVHDAIWKPAKKGGKHGRSRERKTRKPAGRPVHGGGGRCGSDGGDTKAGIDYKPLW